ncbi:PLP-dependent aminotransferase family protein [Desulfobacterales bacterium HSG16]|nr:PLP-dependent aminotransferase family protein [Desulfobacterales bacterium HSG16]
MRAVKEKPDFQYLRLANEIEGKIIGGEYRAGDKLPSLRKLHKQISQSISTVYQAYIELENRGIVESRLKSGFYVKPLLHVKLSSPKSVTPSAIPKKVSICTIANSIIEAMSDPGILQLGGAAPSSDLLPSKQLSRIIKSASQEEMKHIMLDYEIPAGNMELRREIAKKTFGLFEKITTNEIITTNGCMDAVSLCLKSVAKPGDTIAVESPTFHGFLQLIEGFDMYALEIQTDIVKGIDTKKLMKAIDQHDVKACILNTTFNNPTGFSMSDRRKRELVTSLNKKNIPIIEDDIYGDLYFGEKRPSTLKSFDKKGLVLYCSSFSKALAPGLRVGWTIPGKFKETVMRNKMIASLASSRLNQVIIARFLKSGSYDRHLRKIRNQLKNQVSNTSLAIARHFPENTKITSPAGGLLLWCQLDPAIDAMELYYEAKKRNISILPGAICSGTKKNHNCIRISCGYPWSKDLENGIITLGRLISDLVDKKNGAN